MASALRGSSAVPSGIPKRRYRSWGRHRNKEKLINIDHTDVAVLTETASERVPDCSNSKDLQRPELMSNKTLIDHLSRMKVALPAHMDTIRTREKLLYLFHAHVRPKPQRRKQRRKYGRTTVPMEVENTCNTLCESWDSPLLKKRWIHYCIAC